MEKNEKIQHKRQRTLRIAAGAVVSTCAFLLVWTLVVDNSHRHDTVNPPLQPVQQRKLVVPPPAEGTKHDESSSSALTPTPRSSSSAVGAAVPKPNLSAPPTEEALLARVSTMDAEVRRIKATGVFMEVDPKGLAASQRLQEATRALLAARYGPHEPYRVRVELEFQPSNPTFATQGKMDSFLIELAPSRLVPHAVWSFLEISRNWPDKKGSFHRRAGHVLQVGVKGSQVKHLAFQEYSPEFPHAKGTVGYAGRPSGPAWYVSIQNNIKNHGPGSQGAKNPHEADSCFGKVVEGFESVVLQRITKMPGEGFLQRPAHVLINQMVILVPTDEGATTYKEWKPSAETIRLTATKK